MKTASLSIENDAVMKMFMKCKTTVDPFDSHEFQDKDLRFQEMYSHYQVARVILLLQFLLMKKYFFC